MRSALRTVAARFYWVSTDALAALRGKVLIVAYHRVIPRGELETTFVQPGMYVTPGTLERHLRFFTDHFKLLSFQQLLTAWQEDSWDPAARYCTITFDDGWLDNYRYAYPLLRAYGAPATVFLSTDLIGTRDWLWSDQLANALQHDRLGGRVGIVREILTPLAGRCWESAVDGRDVAATLDSLVELAKALPEEARDRLIHRIRQASGLPVPDDRCFLAWDEVREMSRHGIAFGSHTCTHPPLGRINRQRLQRELQRSLDVLRRECFNGVPVLSYPYGNYTDAVVAEARAAGYLAAVTMDQGLESSQPADPFRLRRIGVHDDVGRSIPLVAFHIARQCRPTRAIL